MGVFKIYLVYKKKLDMLFFKKKEKKKSWDNDMFYGKRPVISDL